MIYILDVVLEIEKIIRGQFDNIVWFEYRYGRIIVLFFFFVMYFKFIDNFENYILKKIFSFFVDSFYFFVFFFVFGKKYEFVVR